MPHFLIIVGTDQKTKKRYLSSISEHTTEYRANKALDKKNLSSGYTATVINTLRSGAIGKRELREKIADEFGWDVAKRNFKSS